jgi:hypothetical protein
MGHRHAHIFGLAACVTAGQVGVAEQAGRRVAELLGRHRRVAIGALANGIIAELAPPALAAIDIEGNDDPIALPELRMSRAGLDHLAHELVTEDVAALHRRHQAIHQMKVRAADRAARHLDDDVARLLDFRIGTLSQRISFVPCQQSAFMEWALVISMRWKWACRANKFRPATASNRLAGCR